jgi:hypothetical protein
MDSIGVLKSDLRGACLTAGRLTLSRRRARSFGRGGGLRMTAKSLPCSGRRVCASPRNLLQCTSVIRLGKNASMSTVVHCSACRGHDLRRLPEPERLSTKE